MLWSKFASNSLRFGLLPRLVIWVKTLARKQFYTQDPLDCCSGGKICSWEHWVVGNRKLFHDGTAQGLFLDVSLPSLSPGTPTDRSWARKCLVMCCLYVSLSCFTLRNISSTLKCGPVLKSSLLTLNYCSVFPVHCLRALWTSFFSCCLPWQTVLLSSNQYSFSAAVQIFFHLIMSWVRSDAL